MGNFCLTSPDFPSEGAIPKEYTCIGKNISPALGWKNPPKNTKSFALAVVDPDAPSGHFIHWIIYNIPVEVDTLSRAVANELTLENGTMQGRNDFGEIGYGGPCPPRSERHAYVFTVYALDAMLPLQPKASHQELQNTMKGHVLAEAKLIGFFAK